jgi:pyruvate dehydrogenase E2 component (dihydrolipoamide acetyltransferase)
LVQSKTSVPHFTVSLAIDMDPLIELRKTLNSQLESQGVKLSVGDFITRAAALACVQHPAVNSSWNESTIEQHGTVNVGVAVALPEERGGGLIVPVLRDVQQRGLRWISEETKRLAKKARDQGLSQQEMEGGTFTISNLGMFGVDHFEAIINPPQAAILAVGAAIEKPVVKQGQITIGHEMTATLSGDHRVVDGAIGAAYLQTLKQMLENPAGLLV